MKRAQCSLLFSDDEVFNYLVAPKKEAKELNSFIVKLIQSYYYCEEVRRFVDGEDFIPKSEAAVNNEDMYSAIRESLATMDIILEDGKNVLDDSIQTFRDAVNEAQSSGVVKEQDAGNDCVVPLLNREKTESQTQSNDIGISGSIAEMILSQLEELREKISKVEGDVGALKGGTKVSEESVVSPTEKVEESVGSGVINGHDNNDFDFSESVIEESDGEPLFVQESEVAEEEVSYNESEVAPVNGEAASAMKDLLGSLYG